jgi:hypothetical protein
MSKVDAAVADSFVMKGDQLAASSIRAASRPPAASLIRT